MLKTIYQEKGFEDRMDYLKQLAIDYDVDIYEVCAVAELLGTTEDFDGLVSMVRDMGGY